MANRTNKTKKKMISSINKSELISTNNNYISNEYVLPDGPLQSPFLSLAQRNFVVHLPENIPKKKNIGQSRLERLQKEISLKKINDSRIREEIRPLAKTLSEESMPRINLEDCEPSRTSCTCNKPSVTIMCRMCGLKFKDWCSVHYPWGHNDYMMKRCPNSTCCSEKLEQLKDF